MGEVGGSIPPWPPFWWRLGLGPLARGRAAVALTDLGGLAQSVECVVSNDEAPGSKPGFSIFAPFGICGMILTIPLIIVSTTDLGV